MINGGAERTIPFPHIHLAETSELPHVTVQPWYKRRLTDLGVISMAHTEPRPPGIILNYTTLLFYITVLTFIAGGFWWTWQRAEESGKKQQKAEDDQQHLVERINQQAGQIETVNRKADNAQLIAAGGEPTPTPAKKKKTQDSKPTTGE